MPPPETDMPGDELQRTFFAKPQRADDYVTMSLGFLRSAVLRAGLELRIFDHMAKGPADAKTIAAAAGTDPRATRLLLQGLAALDTLIVEDGKYRLTPSAQAHLVSGRPGYVGGVRRIFTGDRLWARLGRLADGVRAGGPIDDDLEDNPDTDEWVLQAASSLMFAGPAAKSLLGVLGEWARGRERLHVLDVGCGGGSYGFYMARAHPRAKVWANDGAAVLEEAKKEAARLDVSDRVVYLPGDAFEIDLGGPHDLAIVSMVLDLFSVERATALLRRLRAVLADDGRVAVHAFLLDDPPMGGRGWFSTAYSLGLMMGTVGGECRYREDYERMLAAAGFGKPEVHEGMPNAYWLIADRA